MRVHRSWVWSAALVASLCAAPAQAASHPAGVTYPLKPAVVQPSGLAQPLPSSRRYVLVWKDQLIPDSYTPAQVDWVVGHYVGTQKLFQKQIDDYRKKNPNFLILTYHLAYGLNGADQSTPVGNITGANKYGQEDTDSFTPWVTGHNVSREAMYQHTVASGGTLANRVAYPDPYWLMDLSSADFRSYMAETLLSWMAFPTTKATGVFFDVGFFPWYAYTPATWWSAVAGGGARSDLLAFWNPRAKAYFDALRVAFAPQNGHPRYLVVPNVDAMVDGTDEPAFLDGTDGAFTENWQTAMANPGDWNLSARRICKYATSNGKLWMADVTKTASTLTQAERELILGTFLLLRNGTSYLMLGNSDLSWYPEYELDLGAYANEPPADLEALRIGGAGGSAGGLYARPHAAGVVLVNSSAAALPYTNPTAMKQAEWSGGGAIDGSATMAPQTLTYAKDVPAGTVSVPARSVIILRSPAGAPPPGEEPGGTTGGDGGVPGPDGGTVYDGGPVDDSGTGGNGATGDSSGCSCRVANEESPAGSMGLAVLTLFLLRRRRLTRSE